MIGAPSYFEEVRCRASGRWDQLEQDPELAGPWQQLFKQVQSPRHVVSELLQNADDAGATKASVAIEDGYFVFNHNGEDFTEEHFASLCRFGYSNKRALHTIGFRGVGFKSTFSIGDEVCLRTPSLSVYFRRERFTEPIWQTHNGMPGTFTEIRVAIRDHHRLGELEKNLEDWTKSPASLLFFRSIRGLSVQGQEIRWHVHSTGPVANSHWMALANDPDRKYLLIQSNPASFPDDALEEIRQERMVTIEEETAFPPCKIEIVLGFEGRLFVILPTGVKTDLPFACNAPFIQDPARVKIKDPETSPTNRWLLERVGQLSAAAMLEWLGQTDWDLKQRCEAYALLPDVDREDHSIEGDCGRIVEETFENVLKDQAYILTENEVLEREKGCIAVPNTLLEIWTPDQVQRLFGDDGLPLLSRRINSKDRRKLANWKCFDEVAKESVLNVIESKHLPKPISWAQLLLLWAYVADDVVGYHYCRNHKNVRIIPVQGKDELFSASEVVRLGEKKLLQSEEDWRFLSDYLIVLNQNWLRYLAEQRRRAEQEKLYMLGKQVESAYKVLDALGLGQTSDTNMVIQRVAEKFFSENSCNMEDCIRLAQMAATLGASVSESFQYVTRDGYRRPISEHIVYDLHNDLDVFVSDQWYQSNVLHEDYRVLSSCKAEDWRQWVDSQTLYPWFQYKIVDDYLQENFELIPIQEATAEDAVDVRQNDSDGLPDETDASSSTVSDPGGTENGDGQITDHIAPPATDDTGTEVNDPQTGQDELQADEDGTFDDGSEPRKQRPKRTKPKLIERFAKVRGYVKDSGEGRFYHEDGSWIERVSGNSFPWERYSASGELMQCYWTKEHCIEREPLQLEADVWELCIKKPDKYTLILTDFDGNPAEYSGERICVLRDTERLMLYPAIYRVVYEKDQAL